MIYYLYQLTFSTPVHFGRAELGGKLEKVDFSLTADTMFNAICCELSSYQADEVLDDFIENCRQGKIALSDLFPYKEAEGNLNYYVPKPIYATTAQAHTNLVKSKAEFLAKQKLKAIQYVPAGQLKDYFKAWQSGTEFAVDNEFAIVEDRKQVNCRGRESRPYTVGTYRLLADCGLYGIIGVESAELMDKLTAVINSIGLTGIGGKRSSGLGKFDPIEPYELTEGFCDDDLALEKMLNDTTAPLQMCLSNLWPHPHEIAQLTSQEAHYKLRRYGGFTQQADGSLGQKNGVCMLTAGSCLPVRLRGKVGEVDQTEQHPILRYGKGIYIGVQPYE